MHYRAHARRPIFDLTVAGSSPIAEEAIKRIGEFYDLEATIRAAPPSLRRQVRQEQTAPRFAAFLGWLETMLAQLPRKSGTVDAIRDALARWTALGRFIDDGAIEIDNNALERLIRPITLGRKNWLFAGSDRGGERAAGLLSLIETAKHNGLDPDAYLRAVLGQIADHPAKKVTDLLPWGDAFKSRTD